MSDWGTAMVKQSISDWIIPQCVAHLPQAERELRARELAMEVNTPADLKRLRTVVSHVVKGASDDARKVLSEELAEIAADARWLKSARGRYICSIQRWVQTFNHELRSKPDFAEVAVGGHSQREVVFVTGFVKSAAQYSELIDYIRLKAPPFKLLTDVRLGTWNGPKLGS